MKLGAFVMMLTAMIFFLSLIGIPTGLTPVLSSVGINVNQNTGELNSVDIESGFWNTIFNSQAVGLGALLLVGVISIGLFVTTREISLLILPVIIYIGGLFISTFKGVIDILPDGSTWLTITIALIFASLGVGFVILCFDYFSGGAR